MEPLYSFAVALGSAVVCTPLAMLLAPRLGAVARPRPDRWHERPTPLLGGMAIFAGFLPAVLAFAPLTRAILGLVVAGSVVFLLGLVDDLKTLRPSVKLAGQVAAASLLVPFGVHAIFVLHPVVAIPATLFWIVAITNAFNLIDNMDGLSAGVACISSAFMVGIALHFEQTEVAIAAAAMAGASLGFLLYNFHPARVFMGDSGSLFLGFTMGTLTIMGSWREASNLFLVLLVPLLVLAVPLFDTTLVTVLRKLSGRAISQGGRDHSSHRLVALGLSERSAVLLLWAVCIAFGGVAFLGLWLDRYATVVVASVAAVLILFFGVFLAEAKVYGDALPTWEALRNRMPLVGRLLPIKWLILELATDLVLISAAYLAAYLIRFEGQVPADVPEQIHQLLPIALPIHVASMVFFGVYQVEWRYAGLAAHVQIVKAVAIGAPLTFVAVWSLTRFTFYSKAVFVVSALLQVLWIMGSRSLLRLFREWFAARRAVGRRTLIVGAGDAAERVVREIQHHPELGLVPVALVDDDPAKLGRRVHGVPVLGTCAEIPDVARRLAMEEIIFAMPSVVGAERRRILDACARTGVPYQVALGAREVVGLGGAGLARPVRMEDVIARTRLGLDDRDLAAVRGRTVVVLGAASAAAGELVRVARQRGAERVVLADPDPTTLSLRIENLARGEASVEARIADAGDEGALGRILREIRPDAVVFAATIRGDAFGALDPSGTLERNFLAVAAAARQSAAAGVRAFLLWSAEMPWGPAGAGLRLGEIAAAALGPPRVVVLRFPPVAEDPDNPLGEVIRAASREEPLPRVPPERCLRLVLAGEVAALTLQAMAQEGGTDLWRVEVGEEPLGPLSEAVLRHLRRDPRAAPRPSPVPPEAPPPSLKRLALPRFSAAAVEEVERQVREALCAGRLDDALGAASLLVPSFGDDGGALVALDPMRRKTS
jgi:UDP-GlcNAc:undecaprenyl-phosphate GlcNAc-1-phosphate transferase